MMSNNASQPTERALRLHTAVQELYAAIRQTKRMVGEQHSRPKAILSQLETVEARLDAIYIETSLQQTALYDMTAIAQALRRAYDELVNDAETAYQSGWQDALAQALENAPGDSGMVVGWLIKTLETDSAWRVPAWDGVIELIREARRYLAANSGE
ncbi:MAG: hypothetical protein ACYDBJ_17165 [Aggregatilineales bacterium]